MGLVGIGPAVAAAVAANSGNAQNQAPWHGYGGQHQNNALGSFSQGGQNQSQMAQAQAQAALNQPRSPDQQPMANPYPSPPPVTKLQPVTIESRDDQHTVMLDGMPVFRSADEAEARRTAETLETMSEVMVRKGPAPAFIAIDLAGDHSSTDVATTMYVTGGGGGGMKIVSGHDYASPQMCAVIDGIRDKIDGDYSKAFLVPPCEGRTATMVEQQIKAGESRLAKMARKMGIAWPLT